MGNTPVLDHFIQQSLESYMQDVQKGMISSSTNKKAIRTRAGVNSLASSAKAGDSKGSASLSFKNYLRFVDMGVGRGHPLGKITRMQTKLKSMSGKHEFQGKDKARSPKKIYSPVAYGKLNHLIGKLAYGFTEEAIATIKNELNL
jgi:hypothetical protein